MLTSSPAPLILGTLCLAVLSMAVYAADPPVTPAPAPDYSSFILTPPAPAMPRINGPKIFGVRPGHPFLYTIPATGRRPMTFSAENLPTELHLDAGTGRITGAITQPGEHVVMFHAKNEAGAASRPFRIVVGSQIALTPPLGWNSWNCWAAAVDQEKVLRSAHAMANSGLVQHGWTYINIDDAWQGERGGEFHALQSDPKKFPDMKALCDQIHALGLKAGIYSTPWVRSYAGRLGGSAENAEGQKQDWPGPLIRNKKVLPYAIGKFHFAQNDAKQWAAWGIDYLKYDWNPIEIPDVQEMAEALNASGRDVIFSLSNAAPISQGAEYGKFAHAWRTTGDIRDSWASVHGIGFLQQAPWTEFGGPGHWNDPDMLVVGYVGWGPKLHLTNLTPDEQYTHISLWCLLSAPLLIGCDLERLDPFTLNLLTNDEVLAVDQDSLGKQAVRVVQNGDLEIFVKELDDGSRAVGLFNVGSAPLDGTAHWNDLRIAGPQIVRDLWRQKDLGTLSDQFTASIPAHGVVLLRLAQAR